MQAAEAAAVPAKTNKEIAAQVMDYMNAKQEGTQ